ncbi:Sugar phosphate exchanger 3 like protein [Argiope bruennichi]|uniref:Sugar phosphate exchanger 3 like protein n=1 Tax=Argiope bruennichi TaxID=94029 RepID=A0A8T0FH03_ARGBR|nr:Sugar phosphate exchanger 3 like protein [Argiope bruennichi]
MASRRAVHRSDYEKETPSTSEDLESAKILLRNPKPHSKYHILAFVLTFFSYALFHATRKTFSNVKVTISATWTPQNLSLPSVFDDVRFFANNEFAFA